MSRFIKIDNFRINVDVVESYSTYVVNSNDEITIRLVGGEVLKWYKNGTKIASALDTMLLDGTQNIPMHSHPTNTKLHI